MSGIVGNTSPLIVLAKAGLLDVLPKLFSRVIIPQAVRDEILTGPSDDPMRVALPDCSWLHVEVLDPPLSPLAAMHLGRGEAEVIECAVRQTDVAVILDDRTGRRAAQALGLRVFGTLSVVAMATRQKHVTSFDAAVEKLRLSGMYASEKLIDAVRQGLRDER